MIAALAGLCQEKARGGRGLTRCVYVSSAPRRPSASNHRPHQACPPRARASTSTSAPLQARCPLPPPPKPKTRQQPRSAQAPPSCTARTGRRNRNVGGPTAQRGHPRDRPPRQRVTWGNQGRAQAPGWRGAPHARALAPQAGAGRHTPADLRFSILSDRLTRPTPPRPGVWERRGSPRGRLQIDRSGWGI